MTHPLGLAEVPAVYCLRTRSHAQAGATRSISMPERIGHSA